MVPPFWSCRRQFRFLILQNARVKFETGLQFRLDKASHDNVRTAGIKDEQLCR